MAQRHVTILIDDLTGKELPAGSGETVQFAIDGDHYEIDVDGKGAEKLRTALSTYVRAGRLVASRNGTRTRRVKTSASATAVRAWATANRIAVNDRGRIPSAVLAQYEAAGN